mmetsp:Transcript_5486/g.7412  ORF Transcript_5486/g.7412 Transcript_5486/m.7412 type:complete len:255 (-) Transcript_5486:219-983(-)
MMFHSASTIAWYWPGSVSLTSALSFSDFSSSSMFNSKILGLENDLGCCSNPAYENVFLKPTPSTKKESRMHPPVTFLMPIILRSSRTGSRLKTASTHIFAKNSASPPTSLELSVVMAHFCNAVRFSCSSLPRMLALNAATCSTASLPAARNERMIVCGCTPSSTNCLDSRRNSPARRVTVVVPSPTSESWDLAMETRVLAAGWTISNNLRIVAPSLEMVVLPRSSYIILSIPRGPRVDLTASATATHALMLLIN